MKKVLSVFIIGILSILMFSIFNPKALAQAPSTVISEFDTYPGVLPYSDPNDNLYIGWTLDLSSPGASEGRDVVTQAIGASITGTVNIATGAYYCVNVWVLDRGTTDKIGIDGNEWTFVAPATGAYGTEQFKKVYIAEVFLSTGPHTVTLTHIAPGTAGSYPTNSILDYLELDAGLIGYWKFDEGSGNVAHDSSGHGNDGTVTGAQYVQGVSASALEFKDSGTYVKMARFPDGLGGNMEFTVSLWTRINSWPSESKQFSYLVMFGTDVLDRGFHILLDGRPGEHYTVRANFWLREVPTVHTFTTGVWYNWAFVYDKTCVKMYQDGVFLEDISLGGASPNLDPSGTGGTLEGTLWISGPNTSSTQSFDGAIDEVAVYNYARSAEEIQAAYSKGQGPISYWNLDEGTGDIAYDSVGTNHGLIHGGSIWTGGIVGGALRLEGAWDDYIAFSSDLNVHDAMVVEAWVYPDFDPANPAEYPPESASGVGGRQIIRKSSNYDDTFWLAFYSGRFFNPANPVPYISAAFFYEGGGSVGLEPVEIPGLISEGQWFHIVSTFKRNDYAKLYVNGVEKMALPTEDKPLRVSSKKTVIGQVCDLAGDETYPVNAETWMGKIDEVKIYDYARTAEQIGADFTANAGPVGYWKLDEGTGTITRDSSGNGNDGTLIGQPQWITGISGTALSFDGEGSSVSIPDSESLRISGDQVSSEIWFKPTVTLDDGTAPTCILDKGNAYSFIINMGQYPPSNGEIAFVVGVGTPPWQWISTTTNRWLAGSWYHIAGIYDGSYLRIYVNGILENSIPTSGDLRTETFPLAIGSYTLGDRLFFCGAVDEVKIYNYARTAEEIQNDYQNVQLDIAANFGKLAEARSELYAAYADILWYYSSARTQPYADSMISQSLEELVPFLTALGELSKEELSENVLGQVKKTAEVVSSFKDWIDGVQGTITESLAWSQDIDAKSHALIVSMTFSQLKDLCSQEASAWRNHDQGSVQSILSQEESKLSYANLYVKAFEKKANSLGDSFARDIADSTESFHQNDAKIVQFLKAKASDSDIFLIELECFADLHVYDQDGFHCGPLYDEQGQITSVEQGIEGSYYFGSDADPEFISLLNPAGRYRIEVIGTGSTEASQFAVVTESFDENGTLVSSATAYGAVEKGEIRSFDLFSSYNTLTLYADVSVVVTPSSLNLGSNGLAVTTYIEAPDDHDLSVIKTAEVLLNGTVSIALSMPTTVGDYDNDGIPDLMVKFGRAQVISYILNHVDTTELYSMRCMSITLTITGAFNDGTLFKGSDTIVVIAFTPRGKSVPV